MLSNLHKHSGVEGHFSFTVTAAGFHVQSLASIKSRDHKQAMRFSSHVLIKFPLLGWYEGKRLRDGERGWFLAECAELITCQATIERNMQRMDRLQGLETNV